MLSDMKCLCSRQLGLEVVSAEGDLEKVMRALAHGLFPNTACFEKSEAEQWHHMPTDIYRLVQDASPG